MSITSTLYTGISSLLSYGDSLSVIGHNVANVNTVGFKASRSEFADLLTSAENGVEIGRGVRLADVSRPFLQGALETTGIDTDLAIQGAGLFILQDEGSDVFYSRAGQFDVDEKGNLTNSQKLSVQGFKLDENGTILGGLQKIALGNQDSLPAKATTSATLTLNLDASDTTPTDKFPADAAGTEAKPSAFFGGSNFSTPVTVFDSAGQAHDLTFLFRKETTPNAAANGGQSGAANSILWKYRVAANAGEISGGQTGNLRQVASEGTLKFTSLGQLDPGSVISNIAPITWIVPTTGEAATAQTATTDTLTLAFTGSTQFALPSSLSSLSQDGAPKETRTGIEIDESGVIVGQFSGGSTKPLFQIGLANFPSEEGLDVAGDSLFAESLDSGKAVVGKPGVSGLGTVLSGGVETSTVDLAQEFVGMITSQRAFQVNSRLVTVADKMYDEAANLKSS